MFAVGVYSVCVSVTLELDYSTKPKMSMVAFTMRAYTRLVYIPHLTNSCKGESMIIGLDHVGIAVNRMDDVLPIYQQLLGLKLEKLKDAEQHKIKAAFLAVGETSIELIESLDKESPVSKFLEKQGQGIHHIAFRVNNIEKMLEQLKAKGIVLIDEKPRTGIEGGKIAFLHPKSTGNVLIELCERTDTFE